MDPPDDRIAEIVLKALGRIGRGTDTGIAIRDACRETYRLALRAPWDGEDTPQLGYHEQQALDEARQRTPVRQAQVPTIPVPPPSRRTLKSLPPPPPPLGTWPGKRKR